MVLYFGNLFLVFVIFFFFQEKESWDMNTQEKIEAAGKKKEEGNVLFKAGKYERASKRYDKVFWETIHLFTFQYTHLLWHNFVVETWLQAAKYIEYDSSFSEEEKKLSKTLKIASYLNNAACKLKLKEYKDAEKLCTKVLNCFLIRQKSLIFLCIKNDNFWCGLIGVGHWEHKC